MSDASSKTPFRRPRPGEMPTAGARDELLDDPPNVPEAGYLRAYEAGSRTRRVVFGGLIVGVLGAILAGLWYVRHLEAERNDVAPTYSVTPSSDESRPDEFHWSNGRARLGLSREGPGVRRIVLPDRVIELSEGYEHAQVIVDVRDGRTVQIRTVKGAVKQRPRSPSE